MPRKHLIASGINKKQQLQAKLGNKLAKEIKAAVKVGGPNPEANPRLKAAIDKAMQNNLSKDSIEKNIKGSNKDTTTLVDSEYEGFGPNGLKIIVKTLTDNSNRTISSLRGYFNKLDGQIAKPNSVKNSFISAGEIVIDNQKIEKDKLFEMILNIAQNFKVDENLINDINEFDDCVQVIVNPKYFYSIRNELQKINLSIISSEIKLIPTDFVNLNKIEYAKLIRFLDQCDEDEDVQWVITNFGGVNQND